MLKQSIFMTVFFVSACVTVNIYFPAAAVERAADEIVKETWGGPGEPKKKDQPQTVLPAPKRISVWFGLVEQAYAQDADINVSNPAIRALKESIRNRSESIKPFMDRGNVGITRDGLL